MKNLENEVNEFLNFDSQIEKAISEIHKINAEQFLCEQLMKSFKLLSNPVNSEAK